MCWNGHEDFQSYSPVFVSARNSLLSKETFTTASCAGVRWNDQECAGVGHKLGTTRPGAYRITSSAAVSGGTPRSW